MKAIEQKSLYQKNVLIKYGRRKNFYQILLYAVEKLKINLFFFSPLSRMMLLPLKKLNPIKQNAISLLFTTVFKPYIVPR